MRKLVISTVCVLGSAPVWAGWLDEVTDLQSQQPHWVTPLVTVTPRLEQEYRVDVLQTQLPNGQLVDNYGNGKGLELVAPTMPVEVALSGPAYIDHPGHHALNGYTDTSFLLKYRLYAENEEHGNAIVTAFLGGSLPMGAGMNAGTNPAAVYTPTLAVGKGYGILDVQSTLGYSLPVADVNRIGHTLLWNTALQVHCGSFWPELEYNQTSWQDGPLSGKRLGMMTAGVLWRHPLVRRVGIVLGIGYEKPITSYYPQEHTWLATARLPF